MGTTIRIMFICGINCYLKLKVDGELYDKGKRSDVSEILGRAINK